ncbi:MAG: HemK/PrmC family methyltransferase [Actinomycetota bacterium]
MNTDKLLKNAKRQLVAANERFGWQGDEADQAWDLLAHVLGKQPDRDADVPPKALKTFEKLLKRRLTGEPLTYIIGWVDFLDFRMTVRDGAFVPRLTSEWLAKSAIKRIRSRKQPVHVDLATGIGPVAIGIAKAVKNAEVHGVDIMPTAIKEAKANATKLKIGNAHFHVGDMFSPLPKRLKGQIDCISIHPPYVPVDEVADLPVEIKKWEDKRTLTDGSKDGLELTRRVISEGREWLAPNGWVLIEVVPSEWKRIRPLFKEAGYTDIRSTHGELKLTRVITGRLPGGSGVSPA